MGSQRSLLIMVAVLVLLAVAYFFSVNQREGLDTTGGVVDVVEGTLTTEEIYGLEVYRGNETDRGFVLARQGDDWVMTTRFDSKANLNKLRTLLGNLEGLEAEFRSDDPSVLVEYGLEDSQAVHVVIRDESGSESVHLLLGKAGGTGCFIRNQGASEALLASQNLRGDFGMWNEDATEPDYKSWLDLAVYNPDRNDVTGIRLEKEGVVIAMTKEFEVPAPDDSVAAAAPPDPAAYEWKVTEPESFMARKGRADGILTTLTSLRARDVASAPETDEAYGLGEGADRITVTTTGGEVHVFLFGDASPEDDTQFYFKEDGQPRYWLMPEYIKGNLFKDPDELKPEAG